MSAHPQHTAVRDFYARLGIALPERSTVEVPVRCFADPGRHRHADRNPSCSVNVATGVWCCHGCGARGGPYDAALTRGHTPRGAMELLDACGLLDPVTPAATRRDRALARGSVSNVDRSAFTVTEADVARWAAHLQASERLLARLERERGITLAALAELRIGVNRGRITLPVRGATGRLVGLLRWRPFPGGTAGPKMLATPGSARELFPAPEQLPSGPLLLCEGEPDALAALSAGLVAVSVPGVGTWKQGWTRRLAGRDITLVMDCDPEGRTAAQRIHTTLTKAGVASTVMDLDPRRDDGYDLTDHLRRLR